MSSRFEIPFVRVNVFARVLSHEVRHDFIGDIHQVFFLIFAFEKLLASP